MKNIIIISGLAGSGKTYIAQKIEEAVEDFMSVRWVGTTSGYYETIVENAKEDELLILEMHPPFPDEWIKGVNLMHIVISKDFSEYNEDILPEKVKFLEDWFVKTKRKSWINDMVEYNKCRFEHIGHIKGDFIIAEYTDEAKEVIVGFIEETRRRELFQFANKNYGRMLYHTLNFHGIGFEGTAPTQDKYMALELDTLRINKEDTCLDVGCNVGYISYMLNKDYFNTVYGIDIELENISCANWIKNRFHRTSNTHFSPNDFMKVDNKFDYVFALAVLHHVAKKHPLQRVLTHLGNITNKVAVIEINEMPEWNITQIEKELKLHFKEVKIIGNSKLPVSKKIDSHRWIIHCLK